MFGRATKLITGQLPPKAAQKFIAIEEEARDAQSIKRSASEDLNVASKDYRFALRDYEDLKRRGNATPAEHAAAQLRLNTTRDPMSRAEARQDRAKEAAADPVGLHVNPGSWLESVSGIVLKDYDLPEPKLR